MIIQLSNVWSLYNDDSGDLKTVKKCFKRFCVAGPGLPHLTKKIIILKF